VPSEALLAHVAVSKYADGLPLYRQEGIYARDGVEISRNTMANWMGHVGFHLAPLADRILELIKQGERAYADETTLPTLSPGSGKTKTAWLWTYARDDRTFGGTAPPMVASASRCTDSMTANAHTDSRTIRPRPDSSHHWNRGSRFMLASYRCASYEQPVAICTHRDCGLSQSNQLYAIIRPVMMTTVQRKSEAMPAKRARGGG